MDIDCVIIGVNSEKTLNVCIQSIINSKYTQGRLHIYYVDGGSTDKSVSVASAFDQVIVIQLNPEYPTPGMGRNAGWKKGESPLVHFFDSDVIVAPDWIENAVNEMKSDIGAVRGHLNERYPDASIFNWIGNLEWNVPPGKCDAFGGIVMIRRFILEETGGYDEVLVAGEDPELSQRVKILGWDILHLDVPMCSHDLAMMKVRQYWKRAYRTGYGYAAVALRLLVMRLKRFAAKGIGKKIMQSAQKIAGKPLVQTGLKETDNKAEISLNNFWLYECFRIKIRGGGFVFLTLLAVLLMPWAVQAKGIACLIIIIIIGALLLLFYPLFFRISWFMKDKKLDRAKARIYAAHCSLVVIPEFFGLMRFFAGLIFNKPLRNKRAGLGTGVSGKI